MKDSFVSLLQNLKVPSLASVTNAGGNQTTYEFKINIEKFNGTKNEIDNFVTTLLNKVKARG